MVVESYVITRFQFPRARVMGDSRVRIDTHFMGAVELHSRGGEVGLGFFGTLLYPLPPLAELERVFALDVAPGLLGRNVFALTNRLMQQAERPGPAGLFDHAVEHALWDLQAQAAGLPLHQLLGGTRDRVRAYVSGLDFHLNLDELGLFYAAAVQRGFTAFKLKFGHPDVRWELERLRVLSEIAGPEAVIMVDANEAWTPKEAVQRAHTYHEAGYSIHWLEDPCARDDIDGLAYVARSLPFTHVNVGEYTNLRGRRQLLEMGAADVLNTWGSLTEIIQSIRLADEFKRPVALSNMYLEQGIHAAVAAPSVAWLEYSVQAYDRLVEQPVAYEAGYAIAPDRPGNGLVLSKQARTEYSRPE